LLLGGRWFGGVLVTWRSHSDIFEIVHVRMPPMLHVMVEIRRVAAGSFT
jgi:hypothetical protein